MKSSSHIRKVRNGIFVEGVWTKQKDQKGRLDHVENQKTGWHHKGEGMLVSQTKRNWIEQVKINYKVYSYLNLLN